MRKYTMAAFTVCLSLSPLFAGSLTLEVAQPKSNPEAMAKNAAVVARITACHRPELTKVTATAEGIVAGKRQSIPLTVTYLPTPGTFAVSHDWPKQGAWAVKMVATNPDYKDYATAVVVPVRDEVFAWAAVKHFYRNPTAEDIDAILAQNGI
jgi:hypothetical protein